MERATRQRNAIRSAVESADRPLSPAELYHAARTRLPRIGIATVYRAIRDLVEAGWLRPVEVPGEPARYETRRKAASPPLPVPELQFAVGGTGLSHGHRAPGPRRLRHGRP